MVLSPFPSHLGVRRGSVRTCEGKRGRARHNRAVLSPTKHTDGRRFLLSSRHEEGWYYRVAHCRAGSGGPLTPPPLEGAFGR